MLSICFIRLIFWLIWDVSNTTKFVENIAPYFYKWITQTKQAIQLLHWADPLLMRDVLLPTIKFTESDASSAPLLLPAPPPGVLLWCGAFNWGGRGHLAFHWLVIWMQTRHTRSSVKIMMDEVREVEENIETSQVNKNKN